MAKSFVVYEEEGFVFDDWAAEGHAVLAKTERGDSGTVVYIEIIEIASVEYRIAQVAEYGTVQIIGARFGDYVDLPAGLSAVFGGVQGAVDAVFGCGVLRNLQAGL